MAKKQEEGNTKEPVSEKVMTPQMREDIGKLILAQKTLAVEQEDYTAKVEKLATQMGIKTATLKKRITTIIKENEKGGVIQEKTKEVSFYSQYYKIDFTDNTSEEKK